MPSSALTYSSSTTFNTRYYTSTVAPTYTAQLESATNTTPRAAAADAEGSMTGRDRRVRKIINYTDPKLNTSVPLHPTYLTF